MYTLLVLFIIGYLQILQLPICTAKNKIIPTTEKQLNSEMTKTNLIFIMKVKVKVIISFLYIFLLI